MLDFEKSDISIEWKSLLDGRIVSEIILHRPEFNYVFEDQEEAPESDADINDWTNALTNLVPIDINYLQVHNGRVSFIQFTADPPIDLELENITLEATRI